MYGGYDVGTGTWRKGEEGRSGGGQCGDRYGAG